MTKIVLRFNPSYKVRAQRSCLLLIGEAFPFAYCTKSHTHAYRENDSDRNLFVDNFHCLSLMHCTKQTEAHSFKTYKCQSKFHKSVPQNKLEEVRWIFCLVSGKSLTLGTS